MKVTNETCDVAPTEFQAIFESMPDPSLILDRDLRIVAVNEAYLRATMTKRGEIVRRGIFEVFPDNLVEPDATGVRNLRASLNRVLKGKVTDVMPVQKYDVRKPPSDGGVFEVRYWSPVNAPVFGADGGVAYIIHRVQDVTEFVSFQQSHEEMESCQGLRERMVMMQAEIYQKTEAVAEGNRRLKQANEQLEVQNEKLRQSEEVFASFMRHMPVAAWMKDMDGHYEYANAEAERIFSMPLEALRGKTDREILPEEVALQLSEYDRRVASRGDSLNTIEILRRRDGGECRFIVNGFIVRAPDGSPRFVGGTALDITRLMRAENDLRESEQKFATIFQSVPVGITISNLSDGKFMEINREGEILSGYRCDEVVGRTWRDFNIWSDPAARAEMVAEVLKEGAVRDREMTFVTKSGSVFPATFSAVVIDFSGEKHLLSMVSDISRRKRAEAALEETNRELQTFNYSVAHELRQPLNLIYGNCQAVKMHCRDRLDGVCLGFLDDANKGIERMNRLIEFLLRFSRLGKMELKREQVALSAMAQAVVDELRAAAPERKVDFRMAEGITVEGDPDMLRIVLDNLLGNAWKFTELLDNAVISFGIEEIDGKEACFVRDNGPGFDTAQATSVFTPFARLPEAERHRGFGIGLATVQRIILRHGGRVWAESERGKGATFYFTLAGS